MTQDEKIKSLKKQIAEAELEVQKWNGFQSATKVVNNGGYGAVGNVGFRYFEPAISEAITVTGQYIIRLVGDRLNWFLNDRLKTKGVDYVIGSDTDSCMLCLENLVKKIDPEGKIPTSKMVGIVNHFCETEIEKFLEAEFEKLSKRLNAHENTLDMKREAICDWGLFRAKKNYIMRVWDMEHVRYAEPQLKIAGIETQRADKPKVCRAAMKDMIPIFFDGTETELQEEVKKFKKKFMELPLEDISFPKGVNHIKKYQNEQGGIGDSRVPINSRAAMVYNQLLEAHPEVKSTYEVIKERSKIKYIYLKTPNPVNQHVVGFLTTLPKEFKLDKYIDYETMFEKSFLSPMQSLAGLMQWTAVYTPKLDDLFE